MSPTRRTVLGSLAAAGTVGVAGCATLDRFRGPNEEPPESVGSTWSPPADEWRLPAADIHNTARSALPVARPTASWTLDPLPDERGRGLLAATGDRVVVSDVGRAETTLRAHAAADGAVRWRRGFDAADLLSGGLVADRLFLVTGTDVLALDPSDGSTLWRTPLFDQLVDAVPGRFLDRDPSEFDLRALATLGTVYVQSTYGVHGLDPGDGTERWRLSLSADDDLRPGGPTGLAVTRRAVWATYGYPSKRLFQVTADPEAARVDTSPLRTEYGLRPVVTEPGISPGLAVGQGVASTAFTSQLVAGYGGAEDWTFPGVAGEDGYSAVAPPATDGERVFVPQVRSVDGGYAVALVALDAATGALAWLHDEPLPEPAAGTDFFDAVVLAGPVVADDATLVGYGVETDEGTRGTLAAFDAGDGTERWRVDPGVAPADLAVAGDRLYVVGHEGGVAALARSA